MTIFLVNISMLLYFLLVHTWIVYNCVSIWFYIMLQSAWNCPFQFIDFDEITDIRKYEMIAFNFSCVNQSLSIIIKGHFFVIYTSWFLRTLIRGHLTTMWEEFCHCLTPSLHGQFLYYERGQKQTFFDPLPPHLVHVVIEWPLTWVQRTNVLRRFVYFSIGD